MDTLNKDFWLFTTPIAHRGLADLNGYVENTLPAFINSMQKGYAIETDLRLTKDGSIVCFHDHDLKRLAGREDCIIDLSDQEIKEVTLVNGQKICFLDEFLTHINGSVPLDIELKDHQPLELVDKAAQAFKDYKGEFVFKSFDPRLVKRTRKIAPNIVCGQLIGGSDKHPKLNKIKWNLINANTKAQFVSHYIDTLITPYKNTIVWTIRNAEQLEKAKKLGVNIIFEGETLLK